MMLETDPKRAWIERVLNYRFASTTHRANPSAIRQALAAFDAAQATVDRQIGQLQAKLQRSTDPDLRRIGEFGLNALTGNHRVKLQAALMELRGALPEINTKIVANADRTAGQLASHLAYDEKIRACDRNPFGVQVSIAATLGGALRQLTAALHGVA